MTTKPVLRGKVNCMQLRIQKKKKKRGKYGREKRCFGWGGVRKLL